MLELIGISFLLPLGIAFAALLVAGLASIGWRKIGSTVEGGMESSAASSRSGKFPGDRRRMSLPSS